MKKTESKGSQIKVATVIGGLAAAAVAGLYFINHNKTAQKKVKAIKGWALKAKGEILEKVEKLKEVNEDLYNQAVDAVMTRYQKMPKIDTNELSAVTNELKSHWKNISKEIKAATKSVTKSSVLKTKKAQSRTTSGK